MPITATDFDLHGFKNSQGLQAGCDEELKLPIWRLISGFGRQRRKFRRIQVPVLGAISGPAYF